MYEHKIKTTATNNVYGNIRSNLRKMHYSYGFNIKIYHL